MSNLQLFVVGTLVTLLVTASMGLLIWGAILDGRDEHARIEPEHETPEPDRPVIRVVDAA
jgi:hypothetical protein